MPMIFLFVQTSANSDPVKRYELLLTVLFSTNLYELRPHGYVANYRKLKLRSAPVKTDLNDKHFA